MATLVCDVCSGALVMNPGGEAATCSNCGISYSVERLKEKLRVQTAAPAVTVNVVNSATSPKSREELEFLARKYLRLSDWENAEKIYDNILDIDPTNEEAFQVLNKIKIWKFMEVENGVLKKFTGKCSEVILPEGVTAIGSRAFSGSRGIQTVVFSSTVDTIEREAFYQNRDLKKVIGLSKVKFIGKKAFADCIALEDCDLGENVEYVSDEAFKGCQAIKSVKLSYCLKQLERGAFKGCSSLSEIYIPKNITVISASLFEQCSSLKTVFIPETVTKIEANAFYGCKALSEITLPSDLSEIEAACFKETGLTTISLPDTLSELPVQCFERCDMLTHLVLPQSIKKIGDKAFYYCVALTSITLNKNATVGRQVFFNCRKLMYVNPPETDSTTTAVALLDLTRNPHSNVEVLSPELFGVFRGTPYFNSEILRRRSNKLCERCAGRLGFFGKCKICGFKSRYGKKK